MIARVDAGPFISATVHKEIMHALKQVHHGQARLIRLPLDEFAAMVQKVMEYGYAFQPFQPMIAGLPVDQTVGNIPEIVVVHDDDTNGVVNVLTETEVL